MLESAKWKHKLESEKSTAAPQLGLVMQETQQSYALLAEVCVS